MIMLAKREVRTSAYDLLAVDPNAPSELIATCYWAMVAALQRRREQGEYVDDVLHELTRAYECVSDPERRGAYDVEIGHSREPLAKRKLPRVRRSLRSRLFRRSSPATSVDYYEVLGVSPDAPAGIVPAAFRIMRDQYLRIPAANAKRVQLLELLEEAHATISVPERREKYDERSRRKAAARVAAAPAVRESTALSDSQESANGGEPHNVPAPAVAVPPPEASGPVNAPQAERTTKKRPPILKWIWGAVRALGLVLVAGARLVYSGLSRGITRAARAWRGRHRTRPSPDVPAAEARSPQHPQIVREPPPRPKNLSPEVEDALLGRLEASVKEARSRLRDEEYEQAAGHDS